MPIDLSYTGIVRDIMINSGVGLTLIVIIVYRLLAISVLPCLTHKSLYCVTCLTAVVSFVCLTPYIRFYLEDLIVLVLLLAPSTCLGFFVLSKKWNLGKTISFALLEILLFPVWFFVVFNITLIIEAG